MNDEIDALHGGAQALAIPHIADEIAHGGLIELLLHLVLLQLVARIDHETARLEIPQQITDPFASERTGAASDQDGLVVKHVRF